MSSKPIVLVRSMFSSLYKHEEAANYHGLDDQGYRRLGVRWLTHPRAAHRRRVPHPRVSLHIFLFAFRSTQLTCLAACLSGSRAAPKSSNCRISSKHGVFPRGPRRYSRSRTSSRTVPDPEILEPAPVSSSKTVQAPTPKASGNGIGNKLLQLPRYLFSSCFK